MHSQQPNSSQNNAPNHPNPPNIQPNDQPNDPASNPPIMDSTQSNSVKFFNHNNVDILNQRDHRLVLENENLYDQIDLAEKEYQKLQLQLQQKTLQMEQVLHTLDNQRKVVIELTKGLQERDGTIDSLKQKLSLREITPLDASDFDSDCEHSETINDLKDQIKNLQNSLSLMDKKYQDLNQENIKNQSLLEKEKNRFFENEKDLHDKWGINLYFDQRLQDILDEKIIEMRNIIDTMDTRYKGRDFFINMDLKDVDIENINIDYIINKMKQGQIFNNKVITRLKCTIVLKNDNNGNTQNSDMNEIRETVETPTSADFATD